MPEGVVSAVFGSQCEVLDGGVPLPCLLRGRLKQAGRPLVVGDRVSYRRVDARQGVVEEVFDRRSELARSGRDRTRRGREGPPQVVLANPDQVVFVVAARDPGIPLGLLDRALALARHCRLPVVICVNKMDLAPAPDIRRVMQPYRQAGYPLVFTSAERGAGLDTLEPLLAGKLSFFWGGSGVGKSSLIHALTGREVRVGHWKSVNPRGPHTTNVTRLYPLPGGGLIADTPGFDWLELDTLDAAPDRVELLLPEAAAFAGRCHFPACAHCGEPGCAVMSAVLSGEIDRGRYTRFRAAAAEAAPTAHSPIELLLGEEELLFRDRESGAAGWSTLRLHHLFEAGRRERDMFLTTLGVPPGVEPAGWVAFQERVPGAWRRSFLLAKLTAAGALEGVLEEGEEVVLRERAVVKGVGRVMELRPVPDTWRLRKALKGTAVYESRALWSDLKPPRGLAALGVRGGLLRLGSLDRFELLPELGLGVLTRQAIGPVLDFLEIGGAEDELAAPAGRVRT